MKDVDDPNPGRGAVVVLCTFPDVERARAIAAVLVERRLAACVNLLPGVESIYRWQGKLEQAAETLAIFKTTAIGYPEFERELATLHPYDVPEIVAVAPEAVAETYAGWVFNNVAPTSR